MKSTILKTALFAAFIALLFTGCNNTIVPEVEVSKNIEVFPDEDPDAFVLEIDNKTGTLSKMLNISSTYNDHIKVVETPAGSGKYSIEVDFRPAGKKVYDQLYVSVYHENGTSGYALNIADSPSCNGWSGDARHQENDSELQIQNNQFKIFTSQKDPDSDKCIYTENDFIPNTGLKNVRFYIHDTTVTFWKNGDTSTQKVISNKNLFALNGQSDSEGGVNYKLYVGINRVVQQNSSRTGSGITRVYISLRNRYKKAWYHNTGQYNVTVEKIRRHKVGSNDCDAGSHTGQLRGINNADQYDVRVARFEDDNPETIVFLTSGQQNPDGRLGSVTGQNTDCKDFSGDNGGKTLNETSFFGRLRQHPELKWTGNKSEGKTTYLFAMDHAMNMHENDQDEIVSSFSKWVMAYMTSNTKRIILAGSSRGGALVAMMARYMRKHPAFRMNGNIYIYTVLFDPTAAHDSDYWEFNVTGTTTQNPLGGDYKCYKVDVANQIVGYSGFDRTKYYNSASGGDQVFAHRSFADIGNHWIYRHNWVKYPHTDITQLHNNDIQKNTMDPAMDWLDMGMKWEGNSLWHKLF